MTEQTMSFQAEVAKLLHIVANSLYSEREIFLRELISNASDACDKLRHLALTEPGLTADDPEFRVVLSTDKKAGTLTISDNGIGMSRDELIDNLGTIARSGTSAFVEQLAADAEKDNGGPSLIGQFGVGFYSAFMVSKQVEVVSKRAGEDQAWRWTSDGAGEFTVAEAERDVRGTTITLHLSKTGKEFQDPSRITDIVKRYSDHIALPIVLTKDDGEDVLNTASALWTRPKKEITPDQYKEFYHHVAHAFDEPWTTLHARVEGRMEYTLLLFIPETAPYDLFEPSRKHHVKLYVKRVFITDDCPDLVPSYLRFLRGVVDSEDLSLNVSREMLQNDPLLARIRGALVKRVLGELEKKADKAPDEYAKFWNVFGAVLKEGIYEDQDQRDRLMKLARFKSTAGEGLVSLGDYVERMRENQTAIYYIAGESEAALRASPQLEGYAARGIEVLLLTDPVDDFWTGMVEGFEGKPFKSVTRGGADLDAIEPEKADDDKTDDKAPEDEVSALVQALKDRLGETVKDVRVSGRLTESAVCLVADEGELDMHLERMLKAHKQLSQSLPRILEINPGHALIKSLAGIAAKNAAATEIDEAAPLLLDQARIIEGEPLPDPVAFAHRLAAVMAKGLV